MSVGRWLLNAVVVLSMVVVIVRGGGALHLWQVPDFGGAKHANEQTVDECLRQGASALGSALTQVAPANARYLTAARLTKALRPFCEKWVQSPETGSLTRETGPRFVSRLLRENPSVSEPLCLAGIRADFAARARIFRYLTKSERRRLPRDTCRLELRYMREDRPVVDYSALIAHHPGIYVVVCAASLQSDLAQVAIERFTRAQRRRIARRSCREALRAGIVNASGAGGLLDARVNLHALKAIVLRFAQREARA